MTGSMSEFLFIHPYLIDYPITDDGNFYRTDEEVVSSCGKLKAGVYYIVPYSKASTDAETPSTV